jgi:hypothetical protein
MSMLPSVGDLEENTTRDFTPQTLERVQHSLRHPINLHQQREGHQFERLLCKFFAL